MSMRVPSRLITAIPRSVTKATALPSPVQRVVNGRDVLAASVVSDRGRDPSRLAAQSTNAPDGLCRQYARRPLEESSGAAPVRALAAGAGSSPGSTVAKTSATEPTAITAAAAT